MITVYNALSSRPRKAQRVRKVNVVTDGHVIIEVVYTKNGRLEFLEIEFREEIEKQSFGRDETG